jgi:hypothetical protein
MVKIDQSVASEMPHTASNHWPITENTGANGRDPGTMRQMNGHSTALASDSDAADIMGSAFETAWASLCASGERLSAQRACDARSHLARIILDRVRQGERNAGRLCEVALRSLELRFEGSQGAGMRL